MVSEHTSVQHAVINQMNNPKQIDPEYKDAHTVRMFRMQPQCVELQIRPKVDEGKKSYRYATASLDRADLLKLRDLIDRYL